MTLFKSELFKSETLLKIRTPRHTRRGHTRRALSAGLLALALLAAACSSDATNAQDRTWEMQLVGDRGTPRVSITEVIPRGDVAVVSGTWQSDNTSIDQHAAVGIFDGTSFSAIDNPSFGSGRAIVNSIHTDARNPEQIVVAAGVVVLEDGSVHPRVWVSSLDDLDTWQPVVKSEWPGDFVAVADLLEGFVAVGEQQIDGKIRPVIARGPAIAKGEVASDWSDVESLEAPEGDVNIVRIVVEQSQLGNEWDFSRPPVSIIVGLVVEEGTSLPLVWRSDNGMADFSPVQLPATDNHSIVYDADWLGDRFVIIGADGSGSVTAWSSQDGTQWATETLSHDGRPLRTQAFRHTQATTGDAVNALVKRLGGDSPQPFADDDSVLLIGATRQTNPGLWAWLPGKEAVSLGDLFQLGESHDDALGTPITLQLEGDDQPLWAMYDIPGTYEAYNLTSGGSPVRPPGFESAPSRPWLQLADGLGYLDDPDALRLYGSEFPYRWSDGYRGAIPIGLAGHLGRDDFVDIPHDGEAIALVAVDEIAQSDNGEIAVTGSGVPPDSNDQNINDVFMGGINPEDGVVKRWSVFGGIDTQYPFSTIYLGDELLVSGLTAPEVDRTQYEGRIWTSPVDGDKSEWTEVEGPHAAPRIAPVDMCKTDDDDLLVVGTFEAADGMTNALAWWRRGSDWVEIQLQDSSSPSWAGECVIADGRVLIRGQLEGSSTVWSGDISSFENEQEVFSFGLRTPVQQVIFEKGTGEFLAVGSDSSGFATVPQIWVSSDGASWSTAASPDLPPRTQWSIQKAISVGDEVLLVGSFGEMAAIWSHD